MFLVNCPYCNSTLRLPDEVAGKVIHCLKCKAPFGVSDRARDQRMDTPLEAIDFDTFEEEEQGR